MKNLYMIRHAKSSWEFDVPDMERPLSDRGVNDAGLVAEALKDSVKSIDKAFCSPALRTRSTAKIILDYLGVSNHIFEIESQLYDFNGDQVISVIKNCPDTIETLVIFGHNHAFTSVANLLGDKMIDNMPTSGVVGISFSTKKWSQINVGNTFLTIFPKFLR